MSKSVVYKTDERGNQVGMPTVCPDFRSGVDEAVKHTGPLNPSERKKARDAVESKPSENPHDTGRRVTVRGDDGKSATVHEAK